MDLLDGFLEIIMFEIDHDSIILIWAIQDVEQNLIIEYSKN